MNQRITTLYGNFTSQNDDFQTIKDRFVDIDEKIRAVTSREDLEEMINSTRDY